MMYLFYHTLHIILIPFTLSLDIANEREENVETSLYQVKRNISSETDAWGDSALHAQLYWLMQIHTLSTIPMTVLPRSKRDMNFILYTA